MCGISGIINKKATSRNLLEREIKKMNSLIIHRGPDDEGYYFGNNFAFGHRRLAILDLSKAGRQPMKYKGKNGEYIIVYNGEIYNFLELKEELIRKGYKFKTNTDTEVILASYDWWGENCVSRFNGMWAFAIYDKKKDIIFCSRDRYGIKPFYYMELNDKFIFGSEIKQLLIFNVNRYVNARVLMDYLIIGLEDHTNETFFKGIYKLEQSCNLIYDLRKHKYEIRRYYDLHRDKAIGYLSLKDAVELYKERFLNSIKLRIRSDVKVGTCLSGGLDSSSIAGYVAKNLGMKLAAVHAKSIESMNDESYYAKKVARKCDLDLKVVEPTLNDFVEHIDKVVYTLEEPFASPSVFMQYFVMKKAKDNGCKVMLDGQGGDETLLGYERYYPAYLINLGFFDMIREFYRAAENSRLSKIQLLKYILYFTIPKIRLEVLKFKFSFVRKEYFDLISYDILVKLSSMYRDIYNLQYYEIYKTQLPHLLKYEDKNSMAHSVEARLPFLDYNLVKISVSFDFKLKIRNGWTKYILRKSVENVLPRDVVWRKHKFGFEAPTNMWINAIKDDMIRKINESEVLNTILKKNINFRSLDNRSLWKLFVISKWEDIYDIKLAY